MSVAAVEAVFTSVIVNTLVPPGAIEAGAKALLKVGGNTCSLVKVQVMAAEVAAVVPTFIAAAGIVMVDTPTVLLDATGLTLPFVPALASTHWMLLVRNPVGGASVMVWSVAAGPT